MHLQQQSLQSFSDSCFIILPGPESGQQMSVLLPASAMCRLLVGFPASRTQEGPAFLGIQLALRLLSPLSGHPGHLQGTSRCLMVSPNLISICSYLFISVLVTSPSLLAYLVAILRRDQHLASFEKLSWCPTHWKLCQTPISFPSVKVETQKFFKFQTTKT